MNQLPFEKIKRKEILIRNAETNPNFGKNPEERTVEELIHYGIINLNKNQGPTSHQQVDYVKKIFGINKAGHSGTLDPNVTGVLPIALDKATRIVQVLLKAGKEYVALMHLHKEVSEEKIKNTFEKFMGKIKQIPPKRSAVKRQLREREVYYLEIIEIDEKDVLFRIGCEAGTYIRKLCLHPSTDLICEQGILSAKYFYSNPQKIYSLDKNEIVKRLPLAIQKFPSPNKLIKLKMSSGIDIIVTPDHKLLSSFKEGYKMVESKNLRVGDYLVKSLSIPHKSREIIISDLLDDMYLIAQPEIKQKCKDAFTQKYGSIRNMNRELKLDRKSFLSKSDVAIPIRHLKLADIYEDIKKDVHTFKTQKGNIITLKNLEPDHFYLLGLLASDGNNTKEKRTQRYTRLKFHNSEESLIDRFIEIYKRLFPSIPISKKEIQNNFYQVDTSNSLFAMIAASFGIISPQTNRDLYPLLNCEQEFIKSFLKGYFDGDGNAYFKKKTNKTGCYSAIRIYCSSYINIKRIHQMLLTLGISNGIIEAHTNLGKMYAVKINDLLSKHKFIKEIGTNHPRKKFYFDKILKLTANSIDRKDYIGFHYKEVIEKNKNKLYKMGGNLHRILHSQIPMTMNFYEKCSKLVDLPKLNGLVIENITDIKYINGCNYVYDMTIPKTHNFLIETGFISSNCDDFGKELGCGAHMQELIRTKVSIFTDKNWCTLIDLKDAYEFYKEGNKELIRKYILPFEKAIEHLPKIWVMDNAVDNICHGADVYVVGLTKINSDINKNDSVAVMTLKDELICIGEAVMDTNEMMTTKKGTAVKIKKVFMERGTYKI